MRPGVTVSCDDASGVSIESPAGRQELTQCPPSFGPLLERLVTPGIRYSELSELALSVEVPTPLARLIYYLQFLSQRGFVTLTAAVSESPLATFDPTSFEFKWPRSEPVAGDYLLSRFAYLHRQHDRMVLESPLAMGRVIVEDDRVAAIISEFSRPSSLETLQQRLPKLSREEIEAVVSLLFASDLLTRVDAAGESEEEDRSDLQTWEFHDLLFHTRSRVGRHANPLGATYRFLGKSDPPPVVKPSEPSEVVPLSEPDLRAISKDELSVCEAIETRTSIREFGDPPIDLKQLSEFLYRTARVRARYDTEVDTPQGPFEMEFVSRPYPSGGALYELEIYPLVQRCDGLAAGLYRYDASEHQLLNVSPWSPSLQHLVIGAGLSTSIPPESVQVVIILSSRFSRLAWKYTSIAYALTLKHVGVLYQTMYLTATAMDLAPCAIGSGDSDLFSKAIGGNYYAETSVGEFLLGSKDQGRENRQE